MVDFYNQINLLYGSITEFCSPQSCPEMKATDEWGTTQIYVDDVLLMCLGLNIYGRIRIISRGQPRCRRRNTLNISWRGCKATLTMSPCSRAELVDSSRRKFHETSLNNWVLRHSLSQDIPRAYPPIVQAPLQSLRSHLLSSLSSRGSVGLGASPQYEL